MSVKQKAEHPDKQIIFADLTKILMELISAGEEQFGLSLTPETLLGADLGLKSINLVQLVAAIQRLYNRFDLPFQELFLPSDRPVNDLRIAELAEFLYKNLNGQQ